MGISKHYDEMADRNVYQGDWRKILTDKYGFGEVWIAPGFVDVRGSEDVFWLMFKRKANDWYWNVRNEFIILAGGERITGACAVRNTEVTTEAGFFDTKVFCNEELHAGMDLELFRLVASSAPVKMRVGDFDMVLPDELMKDMEEILKLYDSEGSL